MYTAHVQCGGFYELIMTTKHIFSTRHLMFSWYFPATVHTYLNPHAHAQASNRARILKYFSSTPITDSEGPVEIVAWVPLQAVPSHLILESRYEKTCLLHLRKQTAYQRHCFRYKVSLHRYEISDLLTSSLAAQAGLCRTWSETPKTGVLVNQLFSSTSVSLELAQLIHHQYS